MLSRFAIATIFSTSHPLATQVVEDNCPNRTVLTFVVLRIEPADIRLSRHYRVTPSNGRARRKFPESLTTHSRKPPLLPPKKRGNSDA